MDKNTSLFYQSALALRLDCKPEEYINGFTIFLANKRYYLREGTSPFNLFSSVNVACNKYCVNKLLQQAGLPVPKATVFTKQEFKKNGLNFLGAKFPVVAKPTRGTAFGTDVFCNIPDETTLRNYLQKMFKKHQIMSVEEFQPNLRSYRILVFCNKVIGVVERVPAHVIGDGTHTLQELIDITNIQRKALENKVSLGPIEIAEEQQVRLAEIGMALSDVPQKEQRIQLCYKCNSTVGGTMRGTDNEICQENIDLAITAAKILDLHLVGFDVICEDIGKPIGQTRGFIIEANSTPDLSIHANPMEGTKNCVTKIILQGLIKRHVIAYFWLRIKKSNLKIYFKFAVVIASCFLLSHFVNG